MHSMPSYTVERDIAAALRDWMFETALEHHGEGDSTGSLANLAAMLDHELQEQPDAIELGVTADTGSASTHENSSDDNSTGEHQDSACQLDDDHTASSQSRVAVHYRTAFESAVCGDVRTVATSRRVCAFVESCPSCDAVARFTAAGNPTPYKT